jgi:hydroxyacylglutathione hydrolase
MAPGPSLTYDLEPVFREDRHANVRLPRTGAVMLEIDPIPAFQDNYFWLFRQPGTRSAWVVDPGDATPVEDALSERGLELAGILVTHHHFDHTGGVSQLAAGRPIPVIGPESSRIEAITRVVRNGETVEAAGTRFEVIEVPGHTLDHIAFHAPAERVLFCGDTLFAGGCGRLFEGTPLQMHGSLSRLAALPGSTAVYCAHEYTLANLTFAAAVEPENPALAERLAQVRELRERRVPTVPSTIGTEQDTNPFLRVGTEEVRRAAEARAGTVLESPAEVLAEIRRWKDEF